MATTPGTPTNSNGGSYTSDQLVSSFRTMLTHISELLTADNAMALAFIHGLPVPPSGSAPQRPLDVLMELEKRGVFSHENVEPLIGLLTDLHRVDIINTCAIKEYKERAEQARLIRGDSVSSMSSRILGGGPNSRQPSLDQPSQNDPGLSRSIGGSGSKPDVRAGSGMGRGTPDISSSNLLQQLSLQSSSTGSPRAPCSPSSSEEEECLHSTLTSSPPPPAADSATPTHQKKNLGHLSEEVKADLIAQLASDPQAVSLMREVVSREDVTGGGGQGSGSAAMGPASVRRQIFNVSRNDSGASMDETRHPSLATATAGQADELLSPPIEFKSLNPSKMFFQRQTSTSSTQTDEELSLTQAGAIGSIASSRDTESTSGYDSIQTSFTLQGGHNHQSSGSPAIQDGHQSLLSSSPTATSQATPQPSRDDDGGSGSTPVTPTKTKKPQPPPKKQTSKEFDQTVTATKTSWKVKRLQLCEIICKHNSKDISKDLKLSSTPHAKRCRRGGGGDSVKLTFHLYPFGFGRDEGSFMSMRVCVRVDPRMYLRDMVTVHLKVTTRFPPGEFVTVRTAANSLEDFVLNDFIPHDIVISETSKTVEFLIEAYLTYDNVTVDMPDTNTEELIDSITALDDRNEDEFIDLHVAIEHNQHSSGSHAFQDDHQYLSSSPISS